MRRQTLQSSLEERRVSYVLSGELYGSEPFDPILLLSQLLLLQSCFYVLLCGFALTAFPLANSLLAEGPAISLPRLSPSAATSEPSVRLEEPRHSSDKELPGKSGAFRVSLLFSSGDADTPLPAAFAIDSALVLTGVVLSGLVFAVGRRSRKAVDLSVSLFLLHLVVCLIINGYPTRGRFWLSLASSFAICCGVSFCLCKRLENKEIVLRATDAGGSGASAGGRNKNCQEDSAQTLREVEFEKRRLLTL